jgi:ribosome-associated protein
MRKQVNFCDYFVLCTGNTDRQTKAVADNIEDELSKIGERAKINKNSKDYSWVVVDIGTVIAHVFVKDLREFYNLEYLWREAKRINWEK